MLTFDCLSAKSRQKKPRVPAVFADTVGTSQSVRSSFVGVLALMLECWINLTVCCVLPQLMMLSMLPTATCLTPPLPRHALLRVRLCVLVACSAASATASDGSGIRRFAGRDHSLAPATG